MEVCSFDIPIPIGTKVKFNDGPYPGGTYQIIDATVIGYRAELDENGLRTYIKIKDSYNFVRKLTFDSIHEGPEDGEYLIG